VLFVDRDWRTMDGRWFTGSHDEIGLDVTLERLGEETRVLGTDATALRAGSSATVRLFGVNFPPVLQPSDIDLGPGITVAAVENVTHDQAVLRLEVAPEAPVGVRDLFLRGSRAQTLAVYDSIDRLEVRPEWSMARVGGTVAPKALAQFEARAFDNGPDGTPDTEDDVDLGIVPATWTLEEFAATYDDDDVRFVGTIDRETGLFTPNVDGPNPQRRGHRNNVGDVYVVATYTPEAEGGQASRTLRARAHLLVTVPLYMRWEPLERPQ
jgi:quinohemoprotein amine dehydrogenase